SFNSRTREGATGRNLHQAQRIKSFNSRTREGATDHHPEQRRGHYGFNSRTREGATSLTTREASLCQVSIHAPVRVRRPDEYGLSIKHATKVLRQPDARTGCGQA
ncbi:hypothetical protein CXT85_01795, partial [Akkermansia muciniphila]